MLVETSPRQQHEAVIKYFTPNAQFTHPFCRTGSSSNSRYLIDRIYRWSKIMSPRISAKVTSISFDQQNMVLYVGMSQVFAIWAIPTHRSEVTLVTVLHLTNDYVPPTKASIDAAHGPDEQRVSNVAEKSGHRPKYYITSQNDLYQTDQFIKFVLPWFWILVPLWQTFATYFCVVLSYAFYPVTWLEENFQDHFTRPETPPKWNDGR